MRRVNLIREIDNVRNRLRPDGKRLERRRDRRRQILGALAMLGGLAWFVYEGPGWRERPEEMLRKMAEERGVNLQPTPIPKGVADLMAPVASPEAPSEGTAIEPAAEVAPPAGGSTDWRIRYGLCNREDSCAKLVAQLKPKGIGAELVRGSSPHPTWQVVMGPWPTPTQAEEAMARLAGERVETTLTRSAGQAWLRSSPFRQVAAARDLAERMGKQGVTSRIEEAPSGETVYKVYEATRYPGRAQAEEVCAKRKGMGVDCVVEERPLGSR
ncbi:MAG: SPOR domain-containing protein [Nitrospinae bacterium]|nr:SPOR domain-containing protein [Nitrospinota bacterium]